MKKTLLCAVFLPLVLNAQDYSGRVGINTKEPQATLDISKKELNTLPSGHTQGVLFPEFSTTERSTFTNPKKGTMIYNTDKECIEIYRGISGGVRQWSCLPDVGSSKAQSVAVTAAGFEGAYIGGVPFNNSQKVKFKLENNSFSSVNSSFANAVSIQNGSASISITGCTWTLLPSGTGGNCSESNTINLASGQVALLTYTMGGTPETGTLTANFSKLGAQADQSIAVGLGSASITSPKTGYVVSLTYNSSNIQGKINNDTNKLTVKIPYTSGIGSYQAVQSAVIPAAPGEGGDNNGLSLSIPAGNFGVSGDLSATIVVDGDGEYMVKKLAPGQEYIIATIPYTLNGNNYEVVLKGIGGVPDKKFNVLTNGKLEHQFVYIPITGSDGRTWLNNNLGADYANLNSPVFNPLQQATSIRDKNAYGSLFQWGRDADGHELVTYPTATTGNRVYPNIPLYDEVQLWTYTNNPCPDGYRMPTTTEWNAYRALLPSPANAPVWFNDPLKLTVTGMADYPGGWMQTPGNYELWGRYGSSTVRENRYWQSLTIFYQTSYADYDAASTYYLKYPRTIRCVKD
ncbi:FISUMP domain-containing protein [Riemerella anatipestifer]|nr:FISUMP domain-containing protein [Riemerella anatipestifer]MDY3324828.1 FISUMP domain-containing protein [Riemerella anatipestifer]MDY3350798.1 FISUMP domain-containing protein [Riemerella anatipestifer]MDY3353638.1 FISUMP domain-containing protein [Riemerella anatipestifer]